MVGAATLAAAVFVGTSGCTAAFVIFGVVLPVFPAAPGSTVLALTFVGVAEASDEDVYQQLRFDLCPECRKKFMKAPLGRETLKQFDFSQN